VAKLTDKKIKALKPKKARYTVWDGNGFGVRVSPKGHKSFVWTYHFEGRPRRLTLGSYPGFSLALANIKIAEARKALGDGRDPGQEKVNAGKAERAADTVAELVENYIERYAKVKKRSAREDERILRKDVIPAWGRKKAKNIQRRDVISLLDGIVARGAPIAANRSLAVVRRMFNWAISRDVLSYNPCQGVEMPGQEKQRERVLDAEEIKALWRGIDNAKCTAPIKQALKFLLVTGQRTSEVAQMSWDEIDQDRRDWTIPGNRAKNKSEHVVPLSKFAWALLKEIKKTSNGSDFAFPSVRNGVMRNVPVTSPALGYALRRNKETIGVDDVRPHDFRRTAGTEMIRLGTSRFVLSCVLNHADRGVTSIYDRHSHYDEKRKALEAWGQHLRRLVK